MERGGEIGDRINTLAFLDHTTQKWGVAKSKIRGQLTFLSFNPSAMFCSVNKTPALLYYKIKKQNHKFCENWICVILHSNW